MGSAGIGLVGAGGRVVRRGGRGGGGLHVLGESVEGGGGLTDFDMGGELGEGDGEGFGGFAFHL